jgi:hypothetical protein
MAARDDSRRERPRARSGGNRPPTHPPDLADVQGQLHDARSLFAIATLALDGVEEGAHRVDLLVTCAPGDVATLLDIAVAHLDEAIAALDAAVTAPLT